MNNRSRCLIAPFIRPNNKKNWRIDTRAYECDKVENIEHDNNININKCYR